MKFVSNSFSDALVSEAGVLNIGCCLFKSFNQSTGNEIVRENNSRLGQTMLSALAGVSA